jgi:hypothetical protein
LSAGYESLEPLRHQLGVARKTKLGFPCVQLPFPLIQRSFSRVGGPVPDVPDIVSLISKLITPVSDEVALLSRPLAFHVG